MDWSSISIKRITPFIGILPMFMKTHKNCSLITSSKRLIFCSFRILQIPVKDFGKSECCKLKSVNTPFEPSSQEGKYMKSILQNQRSLFLFAVSEQLDELVTHRDSADSLKNQNPGSLESVLHRRIAEIKQNECQIAVEDVMYMSIAYKFSEVEVPMLPKISKCITNNNTLSILSSKSRELKSIHSLDVQEMVKEHLGAVLEMRRMSTSVEGLATTKIGMHHLGRIYATSIMFGYFLKSACLRRDLASRVRYPPHEDLRNYVEGFSAESVQRCAKLRSKECVNVIKNHTWALFGDDECGNEIGITHPSLERVVLEAVAFGSFLWDVERSIDSVYRLMEN
ncbi:hypothetical protein ACHQM5_008139 [Ranunculus cassubicifolius]